jgi:cytochrome P450
MILEVVRRPELLASVRQEIAPFASWNQIEFVADVEGLCSQNLVQSIYAEVLRVHNGTVINRVPRVPDMTVGGWRLGKDEPIVVSTYHTARDKVVWNEGTMDDPHPVDQFWPERFIVDPSDPSSGPVKGMAHQIGSTGSKKPSKSIGPHFSMDGTEGSWVPYGGGSRMCPGRHFAKREMIVTMAMFITAFDIELLRPGDAIEHDLSYFLFGVMQPKGAIPARIRRRKVA